MQADLLPQAAGCPGDDFLLFVLRQQAWPVSTGPRAHLQPAIAPNSNCLASQGVWRAAWQLRIMGVKAPCRRRWRVGACPAVLSHALFHLIARLQAQTSWQEPNKGVPSTTFTSASGGQSQQRHLCHGSWVSRLVGPRQQAAQLESVVVLYGRVLFLGRPASALVAGIRLICPQYLFQSSQCALPGGLWRGLGDPCTAPLSSVQELVPHPDLRIALEKQLWVLHRPGSSEIVLVCCQPVIPGTGVLNSYIDTPWSGTQQTAGAYPRSSSGGAEGGLSWSVAQQSVQQAWQLALQRGRPPCLLSTLVNRRGPRVRPSL